MFESLSDRLTGALQGLRGKGRLTDADIEATTREIRLALLEADVSLPVVRAFVTRIKDRAKGAEVSGALNPAQQVVKIVNEELIGILGGETRQLAFAKTPPTVVMTAGLDPLRDSGRNYAAHLIQAGTDVIYIEMRGSIHGWVNMRKAIPSTGKDLADIIAAMKLMLARHG